MLKYQSGVHNCLCCLNHYLFIITEAWAGATTETAGMRKSLSKILLLDNGLTAGHHKMDILS
jgi:hypothetical protein